LAGFDALNDSIVQLMLFSASRAAHRRPLLRDVAQMRAVSIQ
jgi:hypothetical protein